MGWAVQLCSPPGPSPPPVLSCGLQQQWRGHPGISALLLGWGQCFLASPFLSPEGREDFSERGKVPGAAATVKMED